MIDEKIQHTIDGEFSRAAGAKAAGNEGMVRVCARRAANAAVTLWLQDHPRPAWGADAITRLKGLGEDESQPLKVREAAARLSARIDTQFRSPSTDPVADSRIIIDHLLGESV